MKEEKKKNKQKKLMLLLILVLTISVGYAALATTIKINGTSTVKGQNWSVYWDNVVPTEGSVTGANVTTAPTTTGTTTTEVNFAVTLPEPGDYYEFTVDAVNAGSIDAMIAENGILNKVYADSAYTEEATLPKVLKYTVTYADGTEVDEKHLLAKRSGTTPTREKYKVRVEYRNDEEINPSDLDGTNDKTFYFKYSVNYVQADGNAIPSHPSAIHYVNRQVEGQITPGDVIGIGETEDFYVISSTPEKTVLLAKYNLMVGEWGELDNLDPNTPGYGLQNVDAVGYAEDSFFYGVLPFANTNYWMNEDNLISPYNKNDTIYYDNGNYVFKSRIDESITFPYVYDSNSILYPYISGENGYVNKLKAMGAPSSITGRILSYEEHVVCITEAITIYDEQSYWLGSANGVSYDSIENVSDYGGIYGIRPVIEIPTSEIE